MTEEILQFSTRAYVQVFDLLFGKYVCYGTYNPPCVGGTFKPDMHHKMIHMGSGIFPYLYWYKQRGKTDLRLD